MRGVRNDQGDDVCTSLAPAQLRRGRWQRRPHACVERSDDVPVRQRSVRRRRLRREDVGYAGVRGESGNCASGSPFFWNPRPYEPKLSLGRDGGAVGSINGSQATPRISAVFPTKSLRWRSPHPLMPPTESIRATGCWLSIHTATWSTADTIPGKGPAGSRWSRVSSKITNRPFNGALFQNGLGSTFGSVCGGTGQKIVVHSATRLPLRMMLGVITGKQPDCQG